MKNRSKQCAVIRMDLLDDAQNILNLVDSYFLCSSIDQMFCSITWTGLKTELNAGCGYVTGNRLVN